MPQHKAILMTSVADILRDVRGTQEAIDIISEKGIGPSRGPYSNSRLNMCQEQFWHNYINKTAKSATTRFGRDLGSALHDIAEIDTKIRTSRPEDSWPTVENLVDIYLRKNPQYAELQDDITPSIELFREMFEINKESYMGSEERLGCKLDGTPSDFDSPDTWFRGIIDYLEVNSDDVARVVDFKNYPAIHNDADFNDPRSSIGKQLMGYAALVNFNYPSVKDFVYEVYYLRYGISKRSSSKDGDGASVIRVVTEDELGDWWRGIQRRMIAWERVEEFNAQPSDKKCQYCDFITSCSFMNGRESDGVDIISDDAQARESLERLVVLDEYRKRITKSLKAYSEAHGMIEGTHMKYGPSVTEKISYDKKKFIDIIKSASPDRLHELVSIDKRALDRYLRNESTQSTSEEIESIKIKKYSTTVRLKKK